MLLRDVVRGRTPESAAKPCGKDEISFKVGLRLINLPAWYCLLHKRPHIRKDPSFPADSNVQLSGISIILDG